MIWTEATIAVAAESSTLRRAARAPAAGRVITIWALTLAARPPDHDHVGV